MGNNVIALFAMLTVLFVTPAFAQNSSALCTIRAAQMAAAYKPGVDAQGRPVAPANLNAASDIVPDVVSIPLTVDLATQLGGTFPQGTEMNAAFGTIEIRRDGSVIHNGRDLTARAHSLCTGQPMPSAVPPVQPVSAPQPQPRQVQRPQQLQAHPVAVPAAPVQPQPAPQTVSAPRAPAMPSAPPASAPAVNASVSTPSIPAAPQASDVPQTVHIRPPYAEEPAAGRPANAREAEEEEILWHRDR